MNPVCKTHMGSIYVVHMDIDMGPILVPHGLVTVI